jgi:hypothetical protein
VRRDSTSHRRRALVQLELTIGVAMKLCTTSVALLSLLLGFESVATAKDPFSYFRRGATAKTVSQTNSAGKQEGVVEAIPEAVQGVPSPAPPYIPAPDTGRGPVGEGAAQPEYGGGPYAGPYAPGVFSVWPGVPACCDPWLGYCQEPRCYPCAKGQGRYLYYIHPRVKDGQACGGYFMTWAHGKQPDGQCNCNSCGGQAGGQCQNCVTVTDANNPTPTPVPTPAPAPQKAPLQPEADSFWRNPKEPPPPRNALPPSSARTISTGVVR